MDEVELAFLGGRAVPGFPWEVREDGVVILPDKEPEKSQGGIHLPSQGRPQRGRVLALGPGKVHEASGRTVSADFEVGDTVLYGRYAGHELAITWEGQTLTLLNFNEVRLVEKKNKAK